MLVDIKKINFKKYKRIFAFGCSFTSYMWPTWADILASESPDARFINCGWCGGGNILISIKIAEANIRFEFNEDDLIMVMWTTYCREDRYVNNSWLSVGNVYSQNTYPEEFIKKFADPLGYMIRDLGIMSITTEFLKRIDSDAFILRSVPPDYQQEKSGSVLMVLQLYKETIEASPISLTEIIINEKTFVNGYYYYGHASDPKMYFGDYHPNTGHYFKYLKFLEFPLTDLSHNYTVESMLSLNKHDTREGIEKQFGHLIKPRLEMGML